MKGSSLKESQLQEIVLDVANLKTSPLYEFRVENDYLPVVGEGNSDADIMFVGEAPGENEAKTGKPFCGRSGKLLDELLASIGLPRESVYITSIVKDRPPKNRDPKPEEIEIYAPFLDRQIEIICPKVIATLGRFGMEYIMNRYGLQDEIKPIGKIHGQIFETSINGIKVKVIPLYHPALALYNPNYKHDLLEDFKILEKIIIS
jgi:DNA polymerase